MRLTAGATDLDGSGSRYCGCPTRYCAGGSGWQLVAVGGSRWKSVVVGAVGGSGVAAGGCGGQ